MPTSLRSLLIFAVAIDLAPSLANADDPPPPGCVRPEPEAYLKDRTHLLGERLIVSRDVRWIKGLGRNETNTLDLFTGDVWAGFHEAEESKGKTPPEIVAPEETAKPIVRVKQNGWTLDWVKTGRPIVKEFIDAWAMNASRTHLLVLTAEGDGRGFYVYEIKTRKRLRRESWPKGAIFERLPDGEHYLFTGNGRASLTDAMGKRVADVGDEPAYDAVKDGDGVWLSAVMLESHPGVPLLRILHPRCDAVVVQSLSTGEIVRRVDLRELRSSPEATGEGCLALGDASARIVVLPGVHAPDVVGRVDLTAEPPLRTWRLPKCVPVP